MHAIILREANGVMIRQRPDNYFDATAMCRAYGKAFADYSRLKETLEFFGELSSNMGIPMFELVQSRQGNSGGTWVHERVALDLARWLSPKFAVTVNGWVLDLLKGRPVDTAEARNLDPFVLEEMLRKIVREEVEQSVKGHVPIPRAEFSPLTRKLILSEWLRQNPTGLDPTGWVRIIDDDKQLIKDKGEIHHMNGNYRVGFRDGLPVTIAFHRKLTADRERRGDEWRRAINAHKHFLDKHDASQVTLFDMLGRKLA